MKEQIFNKQKPQEEILSEQEVGQEPLENTDAQEKANMMRTILAKELKHEPTAEDYNNALQAVEELEKRAKLEPNWEKNFFNLVRSSTRAVEFTADTLLRIITLNKFPFPEDRGESPNIQTLSDAAYQLKKLKEEAQKFEQNRK